MSVTFGSGYLFFNVVITGPRLDFMGGSGELATETCMVLVSEQAGTIARLYITSDHLHLLCSHFQWTALLLGHGRILESIYCFGHL